MRPELFHAADIAALLRRQKVATLTDLKQALGTDVAVTVFRKLKTLVYRTSYSHRGRYYTLDEVARFDERGLWAFKSILFSKFGTLLSTAEAFVKSSEKGCFAGELESALGVGVKDALLKLVRRGSVAREEVSGRYLYCSPEPATRRQQALARQAQEEAMLAGGLGLGILPDEMKAAIVMFYGLLDEKQRRLYAGIESLKWGHGGDRKIAELLRMDAETVARGRQELLAQDFETERVRRPGAGRKPLEKKRRA